MIVPRSEIHLVNGRRKRVLWVPAERGDQGELKLCKLAAGDVVSLQPAAFVKGTAVTVTAVDAHPRLLDDMADEDAELAGYRKIRLAKEAWGRQHGQTVGRQVWVVSFILGDHSGFLDQHRERYLSRKGLGLTDDPARAVSSEPAVTTAEQLLLAAKARQKRDLEQRQRLVDLARATEAIMNTTDDEATKRMLKRNLRNLRARLAAPPERRLDFARGDALGLDAATSRRPGALARRTPNAA